MRQALCATFLAGSCLFCPFTALHAEESGATEEKPATTAEISSEDRKVIQMMEMLELMELLEDMELLEGEIKGVLEDKK